MGKPVIKYAMYYYFMVTCLVMGTLYSAGQNNSQKLKKIVIITGNKIRLDSLLSSFSKQTQIDFSFNSNKINPNKVISVVNKKRTLAEWLSALQHDMDIRYSLLGDHINIA